MKKSSIDFSNINRSNRVVNLDDSNNLQNNDLPVTSHTGRNFIELDINNESNGNQIKNQNQSISSPNTFSSAFSSNFINIESIRKSMINGFADKSIFPYFSAVNPSVRLVPIQNSQEQPSISFSNDSSNTNQILNEDSNKEPPEEELEIKSNIPITKELKELKPSEIYSNIANGKHLLIYKTLSGSLTYRYVRYAQLNNFTEQNIRQATSNEGYAQLNNFTEQNIRKVTSYEGIIIIERPADREKFILPPNTIDFTVTLMITAYTKVHTDNYDFELPPDKVKAYIGNNPEIDAWGGQKNWSVTDTIKINFGTPPQEQEIEIGVRTLGKDDIEITKKIIKIYVVSATPTTEVPKITIESPPLNSLIRTIGNEISIKVVGTAIADPGVETSEGKISQVLVEIGIGNGFKNAFLNYAGRYVSWQYSETITDEGEVTITAIAFDNGGKQSKPKKRSFFVVKENVPVMKNRIFLIETYRLSTYAGQYKPGIVLKTLSLLPGEKTKISVKSFLKTTTTEKYASSIIDSVSNESSTDFENTVYEEQSHKEEYERSQEYEIKAKGEASWGWGKAEVSGRLAGKTNFAREEFAKRTTNAVNKHSSKASAKREVTVNSSYEKTEESGTENSIEREIQNINVSRTLNFIFRQMNQELIYLLHLIDLRLAFWDGDLNDTTSKKIEVPLYEIDLFINTLKNWDIPNVDDDTKNIIIKEIENIKDYQFLEPQAIDPETGNEVEEKFIIKDKDTETYRINKKFYSQYKDQRNEIIVPGIILAANTNIMRTEGVLVESLLGEINALDEYSQGLQNESVRKMELENDLKKREVLRNDLAREIIMTDEQNNNDNNKPSIRFERVFRCCKPTIFSLWPRKENSYDGLEEEDNND